MPEPTDPIIAGILRLIDEAYDQPTWHGPNLRGSIRRMPVDEAAWRPAPGERSIWELVVHAAYWKYAIWRQLTGEKRGSFPHKGSDWFPRVDEDPDPKAWKTDVALLDEMQSRFRGAVAGLLPEDLEASPPGSDSPRSVKIHGIIFHDLYHAGQIQTIKHLYKKLGRG